MARNQSRVPNFDTAMLRPLDSPPADHTKGKTIQPFVDLYSVRYLRRTKRPTSCAFAAPNKANSFSDYPSIAPDAEAWQLVEPPVTCIFSKESHRGSQWSVDHAHCSGYG